MSKKILNTIFSEYIENGYCELELPNGEKLTYGKKSPDYPSVTLDIQDEAFFNGIVNKGNLGLGEAYMRDLFRMKEGTLYDFLDILLVNEMDKKIKSNLKLILSIGTRRLIDSFKGKQHNIRSHYDIGFDIFKYMLDENLTYSCGYQKEESDSLNDLQYQKFQRIIDKIKLQDGESILDIGCGYGSFLIYAAEHYNIRGVGVTNSKQHADYATARIAEKGLSDKLTIVCSDYKLIDGAFNKIVSIGMLEHVPRKEYKAYFALIKKLLLRDGAALVHAVGCNTNVNVHDPFIQKYIFPNSNQPKLSEISSQIEKQHMAIIDVENIIRHYGPTAKHWLENFLENKEKIDNENYSEEFYKMWEYYLSCCVSASKYSDSAVYQVLINQNHTKKINYARV